MYVCMYLRVISIVYLYIHICGFGYRYVYMYVSTRDTSMILYMYIYICVCVCVYCVDSDPMNEWMDECVYLIPNQTKIWLQTLK